MSPSTLTSNFDPAGTTAPTAIEVIPDTPYDESLWAGADDEGVGGVRTTGQR